MVSRVMEKHKDECDSDADTVCLLRDSESEGDDIAKIDFGDDIWGIRAPRTTGYSRPEKERISRSPKKSSVIYVRGSDSESDDDVIVIDSPKKLDVTQDLPDDFFDRETPPASPQSILKKQDHDIRIPQQPKLSTNERLTCVERERIKRMKSARVVLCRIDEQLLQQCQFTKHNEQQNALHHYHKKPISVEKSENRKHLKSIKHLNKCVPSELILNQKDPFQQKNICDPRREGLSAGKSLFVDSKIKITLEIPLSKVLEIERNKKEKLPTEMSEHRNTNKTNKESSTIKESAKGTEKTKDEFKISKHTSHKRKIVHTKDDSIKISSILKKQDVCAEKPMKTKQKEGRVCDLCRKRVKNVADHILCEHSQLFR